MVVGVTGVGGGGDGSDTGTGAIVVDDGDVVGGCAMAILKVVLLWMVAQTP